MDSPEFPQDPGSPFQSPAAGAGFAAPVTSGLAIASLVLGICSFVLTIFAGIPAIICGAMALSKIRTSQGAKSGSGLAIGGIVTGSIGSTVIFFGCMIALLLPAVQAARAAAQRNVAVNNVRLLALSMFNYESENKAFPAAGVDAEGQGPGLSWRVHMLPYLEQQALYEQFHLDEPWDSEHNLALLDAMPEVYAGPTSTAPPGHTVYLLVTGPGTAFQGGDTGPTLRDIPDGVSKTLMMVEADDSEAVPWTKPADYVVDPADPLRGLGGQHPGVWIAGFFDGSTRAIEDYVDPEYMRAITTNDGGELLTQ